jgi:hypothetical protein
LDQNLRERVCAGLHDYFKCGDTVVARCSDE